MQYTFHVVGLPLRNTNGDFPACAYTSKVEKICKQMTSLGHEVYLYSGPHNTAPCTEHIRVTSGNQNDIDWNHESRDFRRMNLETINQMDTRIQPRDFILLIAGNGQKPIADAFPNNQAVEFGIGYEGVFSEFKVFESAAWQSCVYGARGPHAANGSWWDTVIHNSYDIEQFPAADKVEDYFLYVGRLIERKGVSIAEQVCREIGARLIIAGSGPYVPEYGEVIGSVGPEERGLLMSRAKALFVPTQYVGPFEGVHAEALLCGTPVITTDWGVFRETVQNGVNGYRCNLFGEWIEATSEVMNLDRSHIRQQAQQMFDMNIVKLQYQRYFDRLYTLWSDGWYTKTNTN